MSADIFGRDAELAEIGALLAGARQSAAALVLAGPAGSGKTTLLRAGAMLAEQQGYAVLQTAPARSDVRLAFAGLGDLLDGRAVALADELPSPQARALRVALLEEEAPAHPPEPRLISVAFRSALAVLAASVPVLLVVDDVQWLDQPSAIAIGFAVRRLQDERVGLLCAQRTDKPGAELPLELDRARLGAGVLPLGGLSIGGLHRMLRTRLGSSFPHRALRRIEAQSGGNPLIALELGRALLRRGITDAASAEIPVPETLSGLVDERLAELPPAVLDAARLVAVLPDEPAEQYVSAGIDGAGLDAAVEAGLLEQNGGRLRFSHPLLASAVAAAIPPGRLRELHAIAASVAQPPEARVRHRALAAPGPSAAAAEDLDAAATAAAAHGAPAVAAELFELAASLTPADQPADGARRRLDAARQLGSAGETQAARAILRKLIDSMPSGPARASALGELATLHADDFPAAAELLRQALGEAGPDPAVAADLHIRLSACWMIRGDQVQAQREARQSVADAERSGQQELVASCLAQAFTADCLCGTEDERDLHRALEIERTVASSALSLSPTAVAASFYFRQGRLEDTEAALRQALATAEADGFEERRADTLVRLSRLAGRRGDAELARQLAGEALDSAEQLDMPRAIVSALYACASAALQLGDAPEARAMASRGMELAQRTGDRPYAVCHEAVLGSVDLALGDHPAAASRLGPLTATVPEIGWHVTTQSIAPDVVEALAATGELDNAAAFLAELERNMRDPLTSALAARCRGLLAVARGDLQAAMTEFSESLRLHDRISPHPLEQGRTLLALGATQRRLKLRGAARATLAEALRIFERISAPLWAAKTRDELARIGGRAAGPVELTATELRVAELVASGRSNKEAAAELFVTVRAVESTLTKAYAKLGVRSRTELAAFMHRSAAGTPAQAARDGTADSEAVRGHA